MKSKKLNKKSLKQQGGEQENQQPELNPALEDLIPSIKAALEQGTSVKELISELAQQQIPITDIQLALSQIGMSEDQIAGAFRELQEEQQAVQQQQARPVGQPAPPQAKYGWVDNLPTAQDGTELKEEIESKGGYDYKKAFNPADNTTMYYTKSTGAKNWKNLQDDKSSRALASVKANIFGDDIEGWENHPEKEAWIKKQKAAYNKELNKERSTKGSNNIKGNKDSQKIPYEDYSVKIIRYPAGYSDDMPPGHMSAVIVDKEGNYVNKLPDGSKGYINRWSKTGNNRVWFDYDKHKGKKLGVTTATLKLSPKELKHFISEAQKFKPSSAGGPDAYNMSKSNCVDGVCRGLGINQSNTFGMAEPGTTMYGILNDPRLVSSQGADNMTSRTQDMKNMISTGNKYVDATTGFLVDGASHYARQTRDMNNVLKAVTPFDLSNTFNADAYSNYWSKHGIGGLWPGGWEEGGEPGRYADALYKTGGSLPRFQGLGPSETALDVYEGSENWPQYLEYKKQLDAYDANQAKHKELEGLGYTPYKNISTPAFERFGEKDLMNSEYVQGYTYPDNSTDINIPSFGLNDGINMIYTDAGTKKSWFPSHSKPVGNYNVVKSPTELESDRQIQQETAYNESIKGGTLIGGYRAGDGIMYGSYYLMPDGSKIESGPSLTEGALAGAGGLSSYLPQDVASKKYGGQRYEDALYQAQFGRGFNRDQMKMVGSQLKTARNPLGNINQYFREQDGYRASPQSAYLPMDLGMKGNTANALMTLAEGVDNMFSGDIDEKTGLMKGAWRDNKAKRKRHKLNKADDYDYNVTVDPNDPNTYSANALDLYNASDKKNPTSLRGSQQYNQDVLDNSKIAWSNEEKRYESIMQDRPMDWDLTTKKNRKKNKAQYDQMQNFGDFRDQFSNLDSDQQTRMQDINDFYTERYGDIPEGVTFGVDETGDSKYYKPGTNLDNDEFIYNTMNMKNLKKGGASCTPRKLKKYQGDQGSSEITSNPSPEEEAARQKYFAMKDAYDTEVARVNQIRSSIGDLARGYGDENASYSDVGISDRTANWVNDNGFGCNTYSCQIMRNAGVTIPQGTAPFEMNSKMWYPGNKLPIIPGNAQFNSFADKLGFKLQPKGTMPTQTGDLIRGHMYDQPGGASSGSQHSVISAGYGDDDFLDLYNNPGNVFSGYKSRADKENDPMRTGENDYYTDDSGVMRYVGDMPTLEQQMNDAQSAYDVFSTAQLDQQQQGGQQGSQPDQQQIMEQVAQALQQGANPQEVMQQLVQMGIPEEQAGQLIQAVMQQLQGGQQQAPQQQQAPPMATGGEPPEEGKVINSHSLPDGSIVNIVERFNPVTGEIETIREYPGTGEGAPGTSGPPNVSYRKREDDSYKQILEYPGTGEPYPMAAGGSLPKFQGDDGSSETSFQPSESNLRFYNRPETQKTLSEYDYIVESGLDIWGNNNQKHVSEDELDPNARWMREKWLTENNPGSTGSVVQNEIGSRPIQHGVGPEQKKDWGQYSESFYNRPDIQNVMGEYDYQTQSGLPLGMKNINDLSGSSQAMYNRYLAENNKGSVVPNFNPIPFVNNEEWEMAAGGSLPRFQGDQGSSEVGPGGYGTMAEFNMSSPEVQAKWLAWAKGTQTYPHPTQSGNLEEDYGTKDWQQMNDVGKKQNLQRMDFQPPLNQPNDQYMMLIQKLQQQKDSLQNQYRIDLERSRKQFENKTAAYKERQKIGTMPGAKLKKGGQKKKGTKTLNLSTKQIAQIMAAGGKVKYL